MIRRACSAIAPSIATRAIRNAAVVRVVARCKSSAATAANAGFPGAPEALFTNKLEFKDSAGFVFPIFHVMDKEGKIVNQQYYDEIRKDLSDEKLVDMYRHMLYLESMDDVLYNAQRQGRVSFYMTNYGEEATQIGSAAALKDTDEVFAQYREAGVLLYRGFTLVEFLNQCFATKDDYGKGRQMPVHYGSKKLRFQTISSPLATQIPQAAGAGYTLRLAGRDDVCMCYFGEGAASEGDFHAALNFAATLRCQTIFFCRNNGYAISTPTKDQYKGDGIVARGLGYGVHSIRVDGNDLFAVYYATMQARKLSVEKGVPVLIEAMTYRGGHHSTSDDASRYRSAQELDYWRSVQSPIIRLRRFLEQGGLWTEAQEKDFKDATRKAILDQLAKSEVMEKTGLNELITDVYDKVTPQLQEQYEFVQSLVDKYPENFADHH